MASAPAPTASTSITSSYQLPDLLSLTRKLELRTNRHCRNVILASEKWLLDDTALLEEEQRQKVSSMKVGLLASLCFPTCDLSQLRLVADFWTLLMCENENILHESRVDEATVAGWWGQSAGSDALEVLGGHVHFKHLLPQISRLNSTMSPRWNDQFSQSVSALREAQLKAVQYRREGSNMNSDEYIPFRRNLSGLLVMFSLIEAVEGLSLDAVYDLADDGEDLKKLRDLVADVIALSWDVFSYNIDQSFGNPLNFVHILVTEHQLVPGGAIHQAGSMVRQRFEDYTSVEQNFLFRHPGLKPPYPSSSSPTSNTSPSSPRSLASWIWDSISPSTSMLPASSANGSARVEYDNTVTTDLALFLLGLKDFLVGSLNWSYESEVFFGTKGDSVRGFGWVFLLPKRR